MKGYRRRGADDLLPPSRSIFQIQTLEPDGKTSILVLHHTWYFKNSRLLQVSPLPHTQYDNQVPLTG